MKIRVISTQSDVLTAAPNERFVHLAFRPSNKDIFNLLEACPKMQVLQIPPSYLKSLAKSVRSLLDMQRVILIEGEVWGHRSDITDYFEVPGSVVDLIYALKADKKTDDEIVESVSRRHYISRDLARLVMKEAM
jgi:hypothetical protein